MLGDWDAAKRSLEDVDDPIVPRLTALFTDQQRRERERAEVQAIARHELGNAISIAQANMEALVDGVLEPTPDRLASIRDAMIACGHLLQDLKKQSRPVRDNAVHIAVFDLCDLIASQVGLVGSIAQAKSVAVEFESCRRVAGAVREFRGDPDRVALIIRDVLLGAIRYTPPGGRIEISCARPNGEVELSISTGLTHNGETLGFSLASKLLEVIGSQAAIHAEHPHHTTFALRLPVLAVASTSVNS
jgi:signal transduction histidine kinase